MQERAVKGLSLKAIAVPSLTLPKPSKSKMKFDSSKIFFKISNFLKPQDTGIRRAKVPYPLWCNLNLWKFFPLSLLEKSKYELI
jgi:hypothetical protein